MLMFIKSKSLELTHMEYEIFRTHVVWKLQLRGNFPNSLLPLEWPFILHCQRECRPFRWLKLIPGNPQKNHFPNIEVCVPSILICPFLHPPCNIVKVDRANSKVSSHAIQNLFACGLLINPLGSTACGATGTCPLTKSDGLYPFVELFCIL